MKPDRENVFDLPCCIEGPSTYIPRAQYALQMLLLPLGINPVWCSKEDLQYSGLYYGTDAEGLSQAIVCLPLTSSTCQYFERLSAYDAAQVRWRTDGPTRFPVLFGGSLPKDDDWVASAFFWLSGWQEYTIPNRDRHGRFPYARSLQSELETIYEPAVDIYRNQLKKILIEHAIPIRERAWGGKTWAFCPTHDIDYLKKWRPGMIYREVVERFLLNSTHSSFSGRVGRVGQFFADAMKPGDIFRKAFTKIVDEIEKRGGRATIFVKTGAHGPHDVFYAYNQKFLRRMLGRLKKINFEIGLHPSYYAHAHPKYMKEEKQRLASIWPDPIVAVRQHYLRYELPHTLRLQVDAGFKIDSTLAFAEQEGFRNATCHPFLRYDVLKNESTDSWEMPLCFMDGSLFNYRGLEVDAAVNVTKKLIQTCKAYNGVCVGLWHNTLWDEMDFPGWGEHFKQIMDFVSTEGGHIDSLTGSLSLYMNPIEGSS